MTIGVGGSSSEAELAKLEDMSGAVVSPVQQAEYKARIQRAQALMKEQGIDVLYANAGTNMLYFTGTRWRASERMVGVLIPQDGPREYISPVFEIPTLRQYMQIEGCVHGWEEHESPYRLIADLLQQRYGERLLIAVDESAAFFISDGLRQAMPAAQLINAACITAALRMIKSETELALMQRAKDMTLQVHKAAARILRPGISTTEVEQFIHLAHQRVGAPAGSFFVIVLFGEATAYPHGVKNPQTLRQGDMVLIDTGCQLHDYLSDITRSYVFGEASERQRQVWNAEKSAQAAAFAMAKIGNTCASVDLAARASLEQNGFGPAYKLPGLPHRTGHGIGLDIHEWPYLNSGDQTVLRPGMCFSNEPMICIPGEFGVRLEDHFYMSESGPRWFTEPSPSIDDPFGYEN
ncbi:MAG: aminopeptidase P family protein [Gammaproteobacteria bacterium]|nr:aminopeptidase P family protein [Gammaproteobacteria bacterium]